MVHLDKVEGQRGSMVMQEDGSVISSTGTLSSSEHTAQTIISLLNHNLQVDFNTETSNNSQHVGSTTTESGDSQVGAQAHPVLKWNRLTVSFPTHSYVACLSNKKIHVVDRDSTSNDNDNGVDIVASGEANQQVE